MRAPQRIITQRLVLRRHLPSDLGAFAAFLNDAEATRYMAFTPEQKTHEGARAMLEYVISAYDSDAPIFSLTIACPQTDAYWGSCGLNPTDEPDTTEVYYTVLPALQGRGLATEAMAALLEYAGRSNGCGKRFIADVVAENVASARVAQKVGFVEAGVVVRAPSTGALPHAAMAGTRYVLEQ